jgi:hypothetical protein
MYFPYVVETFKEPDSSIKYKKGNRRRALKVFNHKGKYCSFKGGFYLSNIHLQESLLKRAPSEK